MSTIKCPKCDNELPSETTICPNCGEQISKQENDTTTTVEFVEKETKSKRSFNKNIMLTICVSLALIVILILGLFAIKSFSPNKSGGKNSATITSTNFTEYFDIQVSLTNKTESKTIIGKNVEYDLSIDVQPKKTINSGSVDVELRFDGYNVSSWDSTYSVYKNFSGYKMTDYLEVPFTFAANSPYKKSVHIKCEHYMSSSDDLVLDYDIISASGTIEY